MSNARVSSHGTPIYPQGAFGARFTHRPSLLAALILGNTVFKGRTRDGTVVILVSKSKRDSHAEPGTTHVIRHS